MGSVQERANRILMAGTLARTPLRTLSRAMSPAALVALVALAGSVALAGCSTPQERAVHKQAEVEQMMTVYGPACERLGYRPNTDPWRNCVLQLNVQDDLLRYQMSPSYCGGGAGYWRGGCW